MTAVIFLAGILTAGRIRFAPPIAALGSTECAIKEPGVYAGSQVPDDYALKMEVEARLVCIGAGLRPVPLIWLLNRWFDRTRLRRRTRRAAST